MRLVSFAPSKLLACPCFISWLAFEGHDVDGLWARARPEESTPMQSHSVIQLGVVYSGCAGDVMISTLSRVSMAALEPVSRTQSVMRLQNYYLHGCCPYIGADS